MKKGSSKFSKIKVSPLEGRFFDIKPPEPGFRYSGISFTGEFWRFFWIAFVAFVMLSVGDAIVQGRNLAMNSQEFAMAGYDSLQSGMESLAQGDAIGAGKGFEEANQAFQALAANTQYLTSQANQLIHQSMYLDTAEKLIQSAIQVSEMGKDLVSILKGTQAIPEIFLQQFNSGTTDIHLTDLIRTEKNKIDGIFVQVLTLQRNLTTLNAGILPSDISAKITRARDMTAQLISALKDLNSSFEMVLTLLGDKVPHRYLILFQNNHELRATGGFIGSYMIVDVNDGAISKMEAKDVYETDGQLTEVIPAPPGIDKVAPRLYMRDSNYSPDFPTSAEKIKWMLEHSRGPSVDTVIAIDQDVIESLLTLTGEIHLPDFPFQIRADNFNALISYYTEAKLSDTSTPKQLLFDMIPVLEQKLLSVERLPDIESVVQNMIRDRHIQAYSGDSDIQGLITRLGLDGGMIEAGLKTDFLSLVTTSIGGNKSDAFMTTSVDHTTEVSHDGLLTDSLNIQKTDTWKEEDFSQWANMISRYGTGKTSLDTLKFILGAGENLDYLRVYVPLGSRLYSAEGVKMSDVAVSEDLGYTVFAFEFGPVSAGETKSVNLHYELPFHLSFQPTDNYRFIAQKQAGAGEMHLKKSLVTSDYLTVLKSYPKGDDAFSLNHVYETNFEGNQIFISAIGTKL